MANYEFHYLPLEGKISGLDFQRQTEDAINDLGNKITNIQTDAEAAEQALIISQNALNVANNAESVAQEAVDSANYSSTSAAIYASEAAESATSAQTTATALTNIYNEAIEQGTIVAPAVDATLSISGAAADAQVTGLNISALNKNIKSLNNVAICGALNNHRTTTGYGLMVEVDGCVVKINGTTSGTSSKYRYISLLESPPLVYETETAFKNGCSVSNILLANHTYRLHFVLVDGTFTGSSGTVYKPGVTAGSLYMYGYSGGKQSSVIISGDSAEYTPDTDMTIGSLAIRAQGASVYSNAVYVWYLEDITLTTKLNVTDRYLLTKGIPADAEVTGEDVNLINGWLSSETGITNYIWQYGYIETNTTSFTPTIISSDDRKCVVVDCVEGDVFYFKGNNAATTRRPWTFLDSSNNVLSQATVTGETRTLTAPTNATKLVCNSGKVDGVFTCYLKKGTSRITELETEVDNISASIIGSESYHIMQWQGSPTSSFPLGWRTGYWQNDGTRSAGKFIMTTSLYSAGNVGSYAPRLTGVEKVTITPPSGYYFNFKEFSYDSDTDTLTFISNVSSSTEQTIPITEGRVYSLHVGEFTNETDAANHLTQEFVDTVVVKLYYKEDSGKMPYLAETRFNVSVNLGWYDIESTLSDNAEETDPTDIRCILKLPREYSPIGKPTPLIMICHGYNGYISTTRWNENGEDFLAMINSFLNAGYAVFGVNNTRNDSNGWADWGCLPLMSAFIKAWDYIKLNYNVCDELFVYSYSMGTTVALNLMKWYGSQIKTCVQSAPRPLCQLRYETYPTGDSRIAQFQASFGLTDGVWDSERLSGFNHIENAISIGDDLYILEHFPPVKVIVGQADTDFLTDTRNYYAALKKGGNMVNYREVAGLNHYGAGYLTAAGLRSEVISWFDRFR